MGIIIKPVEVEGPKAKEEIKALFDTGANRSSIRQDAAEKVGYVKSEELPEILRTMKNTLATAETIIEPLAGWTKIKLNINGCKVEELVIPVKKTQLEELVIGADIMQNRKLILDMEKEDIDTSKCIQLPIG